MDFDSIVEQVKKDFVSPKSLDLQVKKVKIKDKDGNDDVLEVVKSSRYNLHQIITGHHKFDSLFWDDFAMCIRWNEAKIQDEDITRIAIWLERVYRINITEADIRKVLYLVARDRARNPLQEFFDAQINPDEPEKFGWDGIPRLETLLIDYFGVVDDEKKLHRAYAKKFFIGAVRRALHSTLENPVKMDFALLSMGEQGIGKSSAVNALAMKDEWFSDEPLDISSKDYHYHIQGKLLFEMAEWANRSKNIQLEKNFFTKKIDRYRPVYKTFQIEVPRRTSFWIQVNRKNQFNDSTGSRRFLAFVCGLNPDGTKWPKGKMIDIDALKSIAVQIWLEARYLAEQKDKNGKWIHAHWLSIEEDKARADQNKLFTSFHPWKDIVLQSAENTRCFTHYHDKKTLHQTLVSVSDIMKDMNLKTSEMNNKSKTIIEMILRESGFDKVRTTYNRKRTVAWCGYLEEDEPK